MKTNNKIPKIITSIKLLIICVLSLFINHNLNAQEAFVNNGCNILITGSSTVPTLNQNNTISIFGNFFNLNDGLTDGNIELFGGNFSLSGDFINNSNGNVFSSVLGTNKDGYVSLNGSTNAIQFIDGNSPVHFDNLVLFKNRKTLASDFNLTHGNLILDAILELNSKTFIIDNPSTSGITRLSGFIKSETFPNNYGLLQWNIGNTLGTYSIPFGNDFNSVTNNLNFTIKVKTPMNNLDFLSFATYNTDMFNQPMPTGSSPLELDFRFVIDRFWIIKSSNPLNNPDVDLVFSFTSDDLFPPGNSINMQKLKASRNNTTLGQWMDYTPRGKQSGNKVSVTNVSGSDLFEPWTLVNTPEPVIEVFVPDAFTPNDDGLNDIFIPVFNVDFEVEEYELFIYNRWGQLVFQTNDQSMGWNGRAIIGNAEPLIGVYSWVINVKGKAKEDYNASGYTRQFTGRVTLIR